GGGRGGRRLGRDVDEHRGQLHAAGGDRRGGRDADGRTPHHPHHRTAPDGPLGRARPRRGDLGGRNRRRRDGGAGRAHIDLPHAGLQRGGGRPGPGAATCGLAGGAVHGDRVARDAGGERGVSGSPDWRADGEHVTRGPLLNSTEGQLISGPGSSV